MKTNVRRRLRMPVVPIVLKKRLQLPWKSSPKPSESLEKKYEDIKKGRDDLFFLSSRH